jgi:methionine sulfoxide reductase catalytic subunit
MPNLRDRGFQLPSAEITPRAVYEQRRTWIKALAVGAVGTAAAAGGGLALWSGRSAHAQQPVPGRQPPLPGARSTVAGALTMEKPTAYEHVTGYNNFYEFGTDKSDSSRYAPALLKPRPWTLRIDGEVRRPMTLDIDDLTRLAPQEERIYRLRCVEGWSMVIPWTGFSLSALLQRVEPTGQARFVEFTTLADRAQMPGLRIPVVDWPYREALRLDEAMHPLTLLAFGLYGERLPHQNGAPVRLVVPWKYGYKSIKSIVHIRLLEQQPRTSWETIPGSEYGFYANVNPNVDHPRWSQASERRIGEDGLFARRRATPMFNGYEAQVGQLYAGMDLRRNF